MGEGGMVESRLQALSMYVITNGNIGTRSCCMYKLDLERLLL